MIKEIDGDLIKLAKEGKFDVIAHGCNCFCTMGAGIAPQMAEAFGCNNSEIFAMEAPNLAGNINKLGTIGYNYLPLKNSSVNYEEWDFELTVVNAYTQFGFGANHEEGTEKPLDYAALILCFKKINHIFKGKHIGLPWIGCGLAGGEKKYVKQCMIDHLKDCEVTVVNYKP